MQTLVRVTDASSCMSRTVLRTIATSVLADVIPRLICLSPNCRLTLRSALLYRYAVPGHKHMELESVVARMQELGGIDAQTSPSGLNRPLCDKVTMISPNLLLQAEVPVFKVCQYPGEIIITFPRAYHRSDVCPNCICC